MTIALTIADYLKYANLQMAAEAFLADQAGNLVGDLNEALHEGNLQASRLTATQAAEFLEQWEVVAKRPTGSGEVPCRVMTYN